MRTQSNCGEILAKAKSPEEIQTRGLLERVREHERWAMQKKYAA